MVPKHQICIIVEKGKVALALIDELWNEVSKNWVYTQEGAVEKAKEFL